MQQQSERDEMEDADVLFVDVWSTRTGKWLAARLPLLVVGGVVVAVVASWLRMGAASVALWLFVAAVGANRFLGLAVRPDAELIAELVIVLTSAWNALFKRLYDTLYLVDVDRAILFLVVATVVQTANL